MDPTVLGDWAGHGPPRKLAQMIQTDPAFIMSRPGTTWSEEGIWSRMRCDGKLDSSRR